jgi:hypothetical protein
MFPTVAQAIRTKPRMLWGFRRIVAATKVLQRRCCVIPEGNGHEDRGDWRRGCPRVKSGA